MSLHFSRDAGDIVHLHVSIGQVLFGLVPQHRLLFLDSGGAVMFGVHSAAEIHNTHLSVRNRTKYISLHSAAEKEQNQSTPII